MADDDALAIGPVETGYLSEEGRFEVLAFRDAEDETIELQASLEDPDEAHCVVVGGPTAYGAVESWRLSDHTLELCFSLEGQETLELPGRMAMTLDDDGLALVEQHLDRIVSRA